MNEAMKEYLMTLNKVVEATPIEKLTTDDIFEINSFHVQNVYMLIADDSYFLDIRANHFVVEEGFSESMAGTAYLISANHKGIRMQTLLINNTLISFGPSL